MLPWLLLLVLSSIDMIGVFTILAQLPPMLMGESVSSSGPLARGERNTSVERGRSRGVPLLLPVLLGFSWTFSRVELPVYDGIESMGNTPGAEVRLALSLLRCAASAADTSGLPEPYKDAEFGERKPVL